MSNLKLIVLAALLAFCLCDDPVKKSCNRPNNFLSSEAVKNYVTCLKSITGSVPYGKRSIMDEPSSFYQKLHPMLNAYDPDVLEEMLYQILKAERERRLA